MNREIEFRAFDKNKKEYYYFNVKQGVYGINSDIIEQYTGLKDKNGKKIFEGDKWKRDLFIGVVEFKFSGWQFIKANESSCYECPYFHSNANTGEIIGNIHEDTK